MSFRTDKTPSQELSGDRLGPAVILLTPDNHHPSSPSWFASILSNRPSVIPPRSASSAALIHVGRLLQSNTVKSADIDSELPPAYKMTQ